MFLPSSEKPANLQHKRVDTPVIVIKAAIREMMEPQRHKTGKAIFLQQLGADSQLRIEI